ncbi:hypothetical protein KC19_7G135100 [Ceratodon purpureus]|uniref:Uncharacterized protein n=1 Tax=Ceratodon purpureus TaxID=3225 RepID=A0A8T0HAN5_CERPU|nr:hypothetical protein KC19_7G135100 [Ceratodon purpureus]
MGFTLLFPLQNLLICSFLDFLYRISICELIAALRFLHQGWGLLRTLDLFYGTCSLNS